MKSRGIFLAFIALVLAALACSAPLGNASKGSLTLTQAATEPLVPSLTAPTQLPATDVPATAIPPAETPAPTQPPAPTVAQTAASPAQAPGSAGVVVLGKISPQPGQTADLRAVDAVTGLTQATFQAANMTYGANNLVEGTSLFYEDASSTGIHRVGFDGQTQDLTFMNPDQKIFDGLFLPSPDGSRIVWSKVLSSDATGTHVQLIVANVDGSGQKTLLDETRPQPTRPEPVRWSNDGKALYYTNMPYGIGGYILFFTTPDLNRIDLSSGQSTQIMSTGCLCSAVISPDESKVAYVQKPEADQMSIFVRSLSGGDLVKGKLPANHMQGGGIVWAPDSQSFLVTSAVGNPDQEAFTVLLFRASDLSSKTLIPDDPRQLQPILWPAAGVVWLNDKDNNAWRMDPTTGTLTQTSTGEQVLRENNR